MKKLSTQFSLLRWSGGNRSAHCQDVAVAVPTDGVFILNSLLFLIGGFLVFWMAQFRHARGGIGAFKNVTMIDQERSAFSLAAVFIT